MTKTRITMATVAKLNLKFTKTQEKAWRTLNKTQCKELVLAWSRQSGKSCFLEFCCIYWLLKKSSNIGYITPQFAHSRKVYSDITRILEPTGLIKTANASTLQIELVNGNKLSFFSAESPTAIRGNTFKGLCVIDEAAFIADTTSDGQDFFNSILMPTCKAHKPKVIYASTPLAKSGTFYNKFMRGQEQHLRDASNKVYSIKATIYDDSLLTEEEIQDIKDSIPEASFEREFMVEFMDNALSAFSDYTDKFTLKKQIDFNQPLWIGVDFHSVGSDSTILTLINKENDVWQYEIKGGLDAQYRQIADIIDKCKKLVIAYMESNSIGEVMLNEVKKLTKQRSKVIEWCTTNDSKETQVGLVQTLMTKDMMHFEEKNTQLKNQLDVFGYSISKSKRITYSALSGQHDDRVLSLMIATQAKEDYAYSGGSNIVFIKGGNSRMSMR